MSNSNNIDTFREVREPRGTWIKIGSKSHHFNTGQLEKHIGKELRRVLMGFRPRHPVTGRDLSMKLFLELYRQVRPNPMLLRVSYDDTICNHFRLAIAHSRWKLINSLDEIYPLVGFNRRVRS